MEGNEELIKREDIEYRKILLWQLNTCRELQTFVLDGGMFRTNVKSFINSINALRTLLIPYLKDTKRIDISKLDATANRKKVMRYYEHAQDVLEDLMRQMHIKNLLLEKYGEVYM